MSSPVISLVVLAWNQRAHTERCVASLRRHTDVPYELIIVDNGSAPDAAEYATDAADIAVLNDENLGFAAGMNRGLEAASGTYVAFINNDTEFPAGWAVHLLDTFAAYPNAGIVLPAVTAAGNPFSVRTVPGTDRVVVPPFREIPSGVVYVLPRQLAVSIGGWSEAYPVASAEDLDLLFTVWAAGRSVVLDERVLVDHVGSATVRSQVPGWWKLARANRHLFTERWVAMTPSQLGLPAGFDPDVVASRLETAAAAAAWMERTFVAREERDDARQQLARQSRSGDESERWTGRGGRWYTSLLHRLGRLRARRTPNDPPSGGTGEGKPSRGGSGEA